MKIPKLSLVLLVGATGSGKSTFARRHFRPTEIVSSDVCRGLVSDDENDQGASADAFDVVHFLVRKRLERGLLTVVDATNVQASSRAALIEIAKANHCFVVAIVFDLDDAISIARNRARPDRDFGDRVVRKQRAELRRSMRGLSREGIRYVNVLRTPEEVDAVEIERTPLYNDKRDDAGPFDIIGDVHGCHDELVALLGELGYVRDDASAFRHPGGRRAIFLGDLVDRGPASPDVLRTVMRMTTGGAALCVPGNHDVKLLRHLSGRKVSVTHGFAETLAQLEQEPASFGHSVRDFVDGLVGHYVLDGGRLVVAHAGMKAEYQGRSSGTVRQFALYGETTGEIDAYGLPVRVDWAESYRGRALVVYGHTPVVEASFFNNTICIDTGCVFGGRLTALRYPERELVSVPAVREHYAPTRPAADRRGGLERERDLLDATDVLGRTTIDTRVLGRVTIQEENAAPAFEVMSRFAIEPSWLVYLPPTMSPCETAERGGELERPDAALAYFRREGVAEVVIEEKHMGSRAVIVVCRDVEVAGARFGDRTRAGVVYTRTGRPFFPDDALEAEVVDRMRRALEQAGTFDALGTGWVVLDAELLPWSAKAQALLREQYAPVGRAGRSALDRTVTLLEAAAARDASASPLLERFRARRTHVTRYVEAYRRYCWPVSGVDDLVVAPFHLLASEGRVHTDDHVTQMAWLADVAAASEGFVRATRHLVLDLADSDAEARAQAFFEDVLAGGGEGVVVKPRAWLHRGPRGLCQPAVKVRGPEYLRIIYGPEYAAEEHLTRLRRRGLSKKRSLALRELALGLEALHRFVDREPLHRVHACVFGVLALESEPVDPRL